MSDIEANLSPFVSIYFFLKTHQQKREKKSNKREKYILTVIPVAVYTCIRC